MRRRILGLKLLCSVSSSILPETLYDRFCGAIRPPPHGVVAFCDKESSICYEEYGAEAAATGNCCASKSLQALDRKYKTIRSVILPRLDPEQASSECGRLLGQLLAVEHLATYLFKADRSPSSCDFRDLPDLFRSQKSVALSALYELLYEIPGIFGSSITSSLTHDIVNSFLTNSFPEFRVRQATNSDQFWIQECLNYGLRQISEEKTLECLVRLSVVTADVPELITNYAILYIQIIHRKHPSNAWTRPSMDQVNAFFVYLESSGKFTQRVFPCQS
jgi:hypothetical protein